MERGNRYIEFGFVGVGEHQEFLLSFIDIKQNQTLIATYAVFYVYHRRADF